jgi:hypothetical protein
VRRHLHLLSLAYSHWTLYLWIQDAIEELRWSIAKLRQWALRLEHSEVLRAYWRMERCIPLGILEISALVNHNAQGSTPFDMGDRFDRKSTCLEFEKAKHAEFLSLLCPIRGGNNGTAFRCLRLSSRWASKHLLQHLLAQEDLDILVLDPRVEVSAGSMGRPRFWPCFALFAQSAEHSRSNSCLTLEMVQKATSAVNDMFAALSCLVKDAHVCIETVYNVLVAAIAEAQVLPRSKWYILSRFGTLIVCKRCFHYFNANTKMQTMQC